MNWHHDLLAASLWAIQTEELRHRYIHARTAQDLRTSHGVGRVPETAITLRILEAFKGKSKTTAIEYERRYPGAEGKNPKRVDLAIKPNGRGKNWAYVECKHYGPNGKAAVQDDITKLESIAKRVQRWLLVYRTREYDSGARRLKDLLLKNFPTVLSSDLQIGSFPVKLHGDVPGVCEVCLCRLQ